MIFQVTLKYKGEIIFRGYSEDVKELRFAIRDVVVHFCKFSGRMAIFDAVEAVPFDLKEDAEGK